MSIMLSVCMLASSSDVYLLSDSLDNVCLEVVIVRYPSACVIIAVCNPGHPDEIIAEPAAETTAGRAAASNWNEVEREQKLPLCIFISN